MKQGYLILETSTILADHTKGHLCLQGFIKYSLSPQKKIFLSMDIIKTTGWEINFKIVPRAKLWGLLDRAIPI